MILIGKRVRQPGRDDLGTGETVELLHVQGRSLARVVWDGKGFSTLVRCDDLITLDAEAERGARWLTD